jgi:hypothetical protein
MKYRKYLSRLQIYLKKPLMDALFILVPIFSQFFLSFVGCNFSQFAFSSAGHFRVSFTLKYSSFYTKR